jgi:amidase
MAATVALAAEGMSLLEPGFRVASPPARRIGRLRLPCSAVVDRALDAALMATASASGAGIAEVELPGWDEASRAAATILSAEAWQVHSGLWADHRGRLSPDVAARLESASLLKAEDVEAAWDHARSWSAELTGALSAVDVIALPTLAADPPTVQDGGRVFGIRRTGPFNLSGHPAISLPVRTGGGGVVPASLQLVASEMREELLLATAAVIEEAAGARPPDRRAG